MGAYAVSVEKDISFRNATERISNIYHYRIEAPVALDYQQLADAVVARDKAAHASVAAYKWVRVWGPTEGNQADSKMRYEAILTGNGTRTSTSIAIYPELCVVASIFVGRSPVHNRKVFVRKYIRFLRAMAGGETSDNPALDTSTINFYKGWMEGNRTIGTGPIQYSMVTHRDVLVPTGEAAKVLNFCHVRQIKQ